MTTAGNKSAGFDSMKSKPLYKSFGHTKKRWDSFVVEARDILVETAKQRAMITYGDLAARMTTIHVDPRDMVLWEIIGDVSRARNANYKRPTVCHSYRLKFDSKQWRINVGANNIPQSHYVAVGVESLKGFNCDGLALVCFHAENQVGRLQHLQKKLRFGQVPASALDLRRQAPFRQHGDYRNGVGIRSMHILSAHHPALENTARIGNPITCRSV
jgi:hypothetical protein